MIVYKQANLSMPVLNLSKNRKYSLHMSFWIGKISSTISRMDGLQKSKFWVKTPMTWDGNS